MNLFNMKDAFENKNDKNIGQISKSNPGWKGKGVPSLKTIGYKAILNFKNNLLKGNFKLFSNNMKAITINASAFVFKKNQKNVICPCCNWSGPAFITTCNSKRMNYNSSCPNCDSRSRHRGLSILLPKTIENKNLKLIFFAPEKILLKILNDSLENIHIQTTDFYSTDVDFPKEDIQNLTFTDQSFDYILCNHVIEHVPNDDLAFKELSRILQKNGKAIITIPGDYHLNSTIEFKQTDANGHFRHYGLDVIKKMKTSFSEVDTIDLHSVSKLGYGVRKNDLAFICTK
jgi:predicted SAM-dependent methyltransferase